MAATIERPVEKASVLEVGGSRQVGAGQEGAAARPPVAPSDPAASGAGPTVGAQA